MLLGKLKNLHWYSKGGILVSLKNSNIIDLVEANRRKMFIFLIAYRVKQF